MSGKYSEFSNELNELIVKAIKGQLTMEDYDKEGAGARRLAQSVIDFLKGRMMLSGVYPTDVVTWKRLDDSYGEFDVQVGYGATNRKGKAASGRVTAFMTPTGENRYELRIQDWATDYTSYYQLQVVEKEGRFRFDVIIKPVKPKYPYYDDYDEVLT